MCTLPVSIALRTCFGLRVQNIACTRRIKFCPKAVSRAQCVVQCCLQLHQCCLQKLVADKNYNEACVPNCLHTVQLMGRRHSQPPIR